MYVCVGGAGLGGKDGLAGGRWLRRERKEEKGRLPFSPF